MIRNLIHLDLINQYVNVIMGTMMCKSLSVATLVGFFDLHSLHLIIFRIPNAIIYYINCFIITENKKKTTDFLLIPFIYA